MTKGNGRIPPHNIAAEESLLGAMLLSPVAVETAIAQDVRPDDFFNPALGNVFASIERLFLSGTAVDPVTVAEDLEQNGMLEMVGGAVRLLKLQADAPTTSNADRYSRIIVDKATLRRMIYTAGQVAETGYDNPEDVAAVVDQAKELFARIELPVGNIRPSPNLDEFLETKFEFDWLVPGLIERQDRFMLTGPEGGGKSTLLRQLAVALAAGIHPFRFNPIEPAAVLVVDIENTAPQIQRKLRPLRDLVASRIDPNNLRYEVRTGGLDLLHRHDHRWLLDIVAANKPDVLIIGPTYKLHAGDPNDEQPARQVIGVIDGLRERFGVTVIMEAHSPHGNGERRPGRPFGASIWMRWPEFGYGIWPIPDSSDGAVAFTPWRGARDAREWPRRLVHGGPGLWPWVDPDFHAPEERF